MPRMGTRGVHSHADGGQGGLIDMAANADYPKRLKMFSPRWSTPGWSGYITYNASQIVGRLYYTPIFVEDEITYDRIAVHVQQASGASGLARLGIYAWADGLPDALILDAGTVVIDSTGSKEITISETLTRGWYFLASVVDTATPKFWGHDPNSMAWAPIGGVRNSNSALSMVVLHAINREGDVAGGLANPAPASDDGDSLYNACVKLRE